MDENNQQNQNLNPVEPAPTVVVNQTIETAPAQNTGTTTQVVEPKKKSNTAIIIVLAVVILALVGYFVVYPMLTKEKTTTEENAEVEFKDEYKSANAIYTATKYTGEISIPTNETTECSINICAKQTDTGYQLYDPETNSTEDLAFGVAQLDRQPEIENIKKIVVTGDCGGYFVVYYLTTDGKLYGLYESNLSEEIPMPSGIKDITKTAQSGSTCDGSDLIVQYENVNYIVKLDENAYFNYIDSIEESTETEADEDEEEVIPSSIFVISKWTDNITVPEDETTECSTNICAKKTSTGYQLYDKESKSTNPDDFANYVPEQYASRTISNLNQVVVTGDCGGYFIVYYTTTEGKLYALYNGSGEPVEVSIKEGIKSITKTALKGYDCSTSGLIVQYENENYVVEFDEETYMNLE